jgi:mRNA interferase MazF
MARTQTMVQLSEELVKTLDKAAARRGASRSGLIRELLWEGLRRDRSGSIGEDAAGYRRIPQAEPDEWGDVAAAADVSTDEVLRRLDAEERLGRTRAMVSRGEVWWYEHPRAGRPPFLILTRDEAIPVLKQVVGVPATRTVRGIPTEVALDEGHGMPARCCLTLDSITPIRASLCT